MPETFPTWDENNGRLGETTYYTLPEIAGLFNVSETTARKLIAEEHWPHLVIARRLYMTAEDIGDALATMRRGPIPEADPDDTRSRFGLPIPDDPWLVKEADDPDDPEAESFR